MVNRRRQLNRTIHECHPGNSLAGIKNVRERAAFIDPGQQRAGMTLIN
jgi:hypothetical protein